MKRDWQPKGAPKEQQWRVARILGVGGYRKVTKILEWELYERFTSILESKALW